MDTYIHFILDRSGSMWETMSDTIGGFNSFLNSQKNEVNKESNCFMSLYQFDNEYDIIYKNKVMCDVEELNEESFVPRGQTALIDAIGRTIVSINCENSVKINKEVNDQIIVVILTDGFENCSTEFNHKKVMKMVKEKESIGWKFVFLGANQDAIETANNLGISKNSAMTYTQTPENVRACFSGLSDAVKRARTGDSVNVEFTPQERQQSQY